MESIFVLASIFLVLAGSAMVVLARRSSVKFVGAVVILNGFIMLVRIAFKLY